MLTYTFAQELILRGHNVYFLDHFAESKRVPKNYFDWVFAGGNNTPAKEVIELAKAIGAKCHLHLEGVPCWRVGFETAFQWGYDKELDPSEIEGWKDSYSSWMKYAYDGADSCSVNGKFQKNVVETSLFDGKPLPNCHLVSCGADARYALTLPDMERKNYMVTVSRLEPNKKVFKIAEALALLKKQGGVDVPLWVIVGYGTQEQMKKLLDITKQAELKIKFVPCFGAEKWRWIKMARIMLQGNSGVPPAEGLLCNTPVISFASESVKELYGDAICLAGNNNIKEYAEGLERLLTWEIAGITERGKAKLLNGDLFACTQEILAKIYEEKIFI
jgi:glycosyltransferase involved in cell wall biosynthesis